MVANHSSKTTHPLRWELCRRLNGSLDSDHEKRSTREVASSIFGLTLRLFEGLLDEMSGDQKILQVLFASFLVTLTRVISRFTLTLSQVNRHLCTCK